MFNNFNSKCLYDSVRYRDTKEKSKICWPNMLTHFQKPRIKLHSGKTSLLITVICKDKFCESMKSIKI